MKKLFLVLVCLFCVSCFDIFHYIELTADKKFHSEYRISFSKALFAMGGAGGNSLLGNLDIDEILDKPELKKIEGVFSGEKKETDSSLILHFKYTGDESSLSKRIELDSFPIIPYKDENNQYILVFKQNKVTPPPVNPQENKMAEAILSGPVYRLLVGGELKPKKAIFKKKNQDTFDLEVIQLGNQFLIEFPISYILKESGAFVISFNGDVKMDSVNKILNEETKESKNTKETKTKTKLKKKDEESY
ncbi:MAG: hypothetical protein KBF93_16710 [Leptospiraceae bacterium]|nr:hypothetical protein [Leptospiraceae bacterium]